MEALNLREKDWNSITLGYKIRLQLSAVLFLPWLLFLFRQRSKETDEWMWQCSTYVCQYQQQQQELNNGYLLYRTNVFKIAIILND